MAGGTGIKKEFYLNFSRYLCEAGFAVCLFDYRGIGESRHHRYVDSLPIITTGVRKICLLCWIGSIRSGLPFRNT